MLVINGVKFEVSVVKKNIKNIYLKVKGNNIEVTCPEFIQTYEIYNFINSKRNQIYKIYLKGKNKNLNTFKYRDGDKFYIFGIEYRLIRTTGLKKVNIIGNNIYLSYSGNLDDEIKYLYKYLDNRLLIMAQEYLDKYQYILDDYAYQKKPILGTRIMTSMWGVCYIKKNKINLSSYLIHYPLICLEYLVIHELTHFIVPNHSKRFYEIIERNMPNYKEANKLLKQ